MIIFRYLIKEVLGAVVAITAILLLIFLSTQFVHYLGDAALGRFAVGIVFHIMLLQIPYLLGLLLPLGFYLALLMAYGRLHSDREMMVFSSCGISQIQVLLMTLVMAAVVTIIVAILSCWINPHVAAMQKRLMADARSAPLVETIMPGRFYSLDSGRQVFYVEKVSRDHSHLQNIFVAQQSNSKQAQKRRWSVLSATSGYQDSHKPHQLIVDNGYRYSGAPGEKNYVIQSFDKLVWFMAVQQPNIRKRPSTLPTAVLWHTANHNTYDDAELQWRLAMPISVILLTLLAVPLSRVNPRQGKYAQLLPAILIYIFYANMMFVGRDWIQAGAIPMNIGLWWLHGLLFIIALTVMYFRFRRTSIFTLVRGLLRTY